MPQGFRNYLRTIYVVHKVEMTIDPDGTSWSGLYSSTTADPSGNVPFIAPGTAGATRIMVQPVATPAP